jgi:hypothetical protein
MQTCIPPVCAVDGRKKRLFYNAGSGQSFVLFNAILMPKIYRVDL